MKVAKEAVRYYSVCTGNEWSEFFNKLDLALTTENPTGELWLIKKLMEKVVSSGMSVNDFKINKDAIKGEFDEEGRKQAGEFFTPEIFCAEGRKYFDKYIPNWHDYNVWDASCGSGNLMRSARHPADKLFLSSLQDTDIETIKGTPEYQGVTAFQCDFLADLDYDEYNTDFLNKLPERLQQVIRNDEPLIIYMNPPYKSGSCRNTDVGEYMCEIGLNRPAYDIFYQFCWRVMRLIDLYHLKNCYYCFFGPLTYFTGASANVLLTEFEKYFEFVDGMCLSAQEFSDTSESILWGIGCSLWKSLGEYTPNAVRKDVLLEKKYKVSETELGSLGKVLYAPPRQKLSDWVAPNDVIFIENAPIMTSHLTFKGSDAGVKVAKKTGKIAQNALGTLMVGNTLTRSADQSAILCMPTTIQYVSITEENFWRCVASYAFRRVYDAGWAVTKKEISAPDVNVEGYDLWLRNALVIFLFEYKSMMSSIRGVEWEGTTVDIDNKLFFLSAEEVKAVCHDEVILADLEKFPPKNDFMFRMLRESEPYFVPEVKALYDWCRDYTLWSYDNRNKVNYAGSLDCWNAGFQQLRAGLWSDELQKQCAELLATARDYLNKDISKYGFVSEVEEDL